MHCSTLACRFACVSAAAFGTPVVPPVWMRRAMSSTEEAQGPSHGLAARIARVHERAHAGRGLPS